MDYIYPFLKSCHVLGAAVFIGNMLVTAWWKIMSDRTRDPRIVAFAQRQVTLTDFVFTAFGAALVLGTGLTLAHVADLDYWSTRWLTWGLGVFIVSGGIWVAILIPIQVRQSRMARDFADGRRIPHEYWRLGKLWAAIGAFAALLPVATVFWMVFKPHW